VPEDVGVDIVVGAYDNISATENEQSNISGTGALVQQGMLALTLLGTNTYSGGTTIAGGTLAVGSEQALGTGNVVNHGVLLRHGSGLAYSGTWSASALYLGQYCMTDATASVPVSVGRFCPQVVRSASTPGSEPQKPYW
jgi:autotransporter-associated beta strand protein